MPAQEPDGATTKSKGAKTSMICAAISRLVARSPELNAGWPQQVCGGTSTVQPASSKSLTAAKPTDGRNRSTRQVTNSPTCRFSRSAISSLLNPQRPMDNQTKGRFSQARRARRSGKKNSPDRGRASCWITGLRAGLEIGLVAVDELYDRGVVRHRDLLLAVLVFHRQHRAVHGGHELLDIG